MERTLYKRLGILQHQQSRVHFLWWLRFCYQVGFLFSWMILIALFVGHFGIENLIYFFLADAGLFLVGSLLSTTLFLRINLDKFLFIAFVATALGLVMSSFFLHNMTWFLGALMITKNVFYAPMNVAIYRKNESLLSPDEARHVMPILDSAITLGMIAASLFLLPLLSYFSLQHLIYFWFVPLLAIGFLVVQSRNIIQDIPRIELKKIKRSEKTHWIYALGFIRKTKFLMLMVVMVLFQSGLWATSEFVFTHWVQSHIGGHASAEVVYPLQASLFHDSVQMLHGAVDHVETLVHDFSGEMLYESLAHALGLFGLIFGVIALVVQLFLASKVFHRFGVFGTMISFFMAFSALLFGLITGQYTMDWVRGFQHGFHSLFEVGYHITFYSIESSFREVMRHFLEAIIKPLGVFLALGSVVLSSYWEWDLIQASYYVMMGLSALLAVVLWYMRKPYTAMTCESFHKDDSISTKIHIAEILAHKGHDEASRILGDVLADTSTHAFVREKAIEEITIVDDPSILPIYVKVLENETEDDLLRIKVLDGLLHMPAFREYFNKHPFSRHKLVDLLEYLYHKAEHAHIRKLALMNLFAHMPSHELVPFFLEKVQTDDVHLKCVCLRSAAEIFEDPAMVSYTERFLQHENPRVRGHAVIALWKFCDHDRLRETLDELLASSTEEEYIAAIYALGEVKDKTRLPMIIPHLADPSVTLQMHVLVAMAKMEDYRSINCTLGILFGEDEAKAHAMFHMLRRTSSDFQARLHKEISYQVSAEVMSVLECAEIEESGETLSDSVLQRLKHLYRLAGRFGDLWALEQINPKVH